MIELITEADTLERALRAETAVLYKYSPSCAVSAVAATQIGRFADEHPDIPVYKLDVVANKDLALESAERLNVRHQSPQVILMRNGRSVWEASHYGIRATRLANVLEDTT
jgi:bacillithiol system protein YtxJ